MKHVEKAKTVIKGVKDVVPKVVTEAPVVAATGMILALTFAGTSGTIWMLRKMMVEVTN